MSRQVKDSLFALACLGVALLLVFQIKQNNLVNKRQHEGCVIRIELANQGNRSAADRRNLEKAVRIFVTETRQVRDDPRGTSYDPRFVRVIDTRIAPLLSEVRPFRVPVPPAC